MSSPLSRRTLIRGAAVGAVAIGWSQAMGGWVTAAQASTADLAPLPLLDGVLETAPETLAGFAHDFGELRTATPMGVLRPGSVQDVVKMVKFARANGLKVAMNGQSGTGTERESHSNYGQAGVPGGIAIDARSLNKIYSISSTSAWVDAGVTWAELINQALLQGVTCPALTDYLNLTIGGTISVGGIGGTAQTHGLAADTVEEILIVTGKGELLSASPSVRPDLFNAAVAGGGQVGIIVKLKVKLVPAKAKALMFNLYYNSLATYMADQEKIMADGRFTYQSGTVARKPDDSGWWYSIEAGVYYTGTTPDQATLLRGLRDERAAMVVTDYAYRDWIFRADGWEVFLKEAGAWNQPKPWFSIVLPKSKAATFINALVAEMTPGDIGYGFVGFYPFKTSKIKRPLYMLPECPAEPTAYLFDLLRFPLPGDDTAAMLAQNRRLYNLSVSLGAKRYIVGAVPGMTPAEWRAHFGSKWDGFAEAKRRYDPDHVLTPGQGFFD